MKNPEKKDILTVLRWRLAGLKVYYGFTPKAVHLKTEEFHALASLLGAPSFDASTWLRGSLTATFGWSRTSWTSSRLVIR